MADTVGSGGSSSVGGFANSLVNVSQPQMIIGLDQSAGFLVALAATAFVNKMLEPKK